MKIIIIFLFILTQFNVKSQQLDSEELYNKVVLLIDINGNTTHTGTGFLLTIKDQYFLITAKHVANALKFETTEIFFRDSSKTSISFKLYEFLKRPLVSGFNENSDFFILKLETTDGKKLDILKKSSLDFNVLANDRESIDRWIDVLVMGYPLFDFEHFTPITFKSYFSSSLINIKFDSMPKPFLCYLLENPSMAGFSGGPVFVGVKDRSSAKLTKTLIVGIVTGTKYDNTGGKFAIITPVFHLLDLLDNKKSN